MEAIAADEPVAHHVAGTLPFGSREERDRRVDVRQVMLRMGDLRLANLDPLQELGTLLRQRRDDPENCPSK